MMLSTVVLGLSGCSATGVLSECKLLPTADVHSEDEAWSTGLAAFQKLEPLQQLLFLIPPQHADASAAAGTAQRVARYLAAVHTPHRRQHLLVRLVAEDPAAHLVWLVHIFERLRLQQQVWHL